MGAAQRPQPSECLRQVAGLPTEEGGAPSAREGRECRGSEGASLLVVYAGAPKVGDLRDAESAFGVRTVSIDYL